jgi:hypothetical protein
MVLLTDEEVIEYSIRRLKNQAQSIILPALSQIAGSL